MARALCCLSVLLLLSAPLLHRHHPAGEGHGDCAVCLLLRDAGAVVVSHGAVLLEAPASGRAERAAPLGILWVPEPRTLHQRAPPLQSSVPGTN